MAVGVRYVSEDQHLIADLYGGLYKSLEAPSDSR
jgi:hypothetical protein